MYSQQCYLLLVLGLAGVLAVDPDFHSDLVPELNPSRAVHQRTRFTRGTEGNEAEIKKDIEKGEWWKRRCCGNATSYNPDFAKKKRQLIDECTPETLSKSTHQISVDPFLESCQDLKEKNRRSVCNVDCVYRKYGIVDDKGNINSERLKELSEEFATSDWLRQIRAKAIEKCTNWKGEDIETTEPKCNQNAYNLKHCLWKEVLITCPEEHRYKSDYCDNVRKSLIPK